MRHDGPVLRLGSTVRDLADSPTLAIQEACDRRVAAGLPVYRLGLGQSPFPVPEPVVRALQAHADRKEYLPVRGLPALREAVAVYHRRRQGLDCTADDVIVAPGSKELLFLLQVVFAGAVLIPTPAWVSYAPQARILGRRVRFLPTRPADDWLLDPDVLNAACRANDTPRVLVLNYPSNPTGATFDLDRMRAIVEVVRRHGILVLSDEIYGELHFEGAHRSIAALYPEGTIVSTGLSKWCGAGGWRLGAFTFPRPLRGLLDAMAAVASETYTSTSAPVQYAAVEAFALGPNLEDYLARVRRLLRALATATRERLARAGVPAVAPAGAFYLFPDFGGTPRAREHRTSASLASAALEATGAAFLPGSDFGRDPTEATARLSLVDFDGGPALEAMTADPVDEAFLGRWCPRVIEAVERIAAWSL